MSHLKKSVLCLTLLAACCGVRPSDVAAAPKPKDDGISCVMDVVVETRNQFGGLAGLETYHKEIVLHEGETFSDDFSTRIRFKFFDAKFTKVDGVKTISAVWFADVTVFNSVDFDTSVSLEDGEKRGKVAGNHTLYTSNGYTTTRFSLTCVQN